MMNVGGVNPALSALAQKLSGEAKMLADKANKEWFDKRAKKIESDVVKAMKQKEAEEAKKQKEKQKGKRPTVADLRESGALEQDADIICLLYRPEFYGVKEWDTSWAFRWGC